jgi:hypothetical protein
MTFQPALTRKDLLQITGMSNSQFTRNEKRLGLYRLRIVVNPRHIRYPHSRALAILRAIGYEV